MNIINSKDTVNVIITKEFQAIVEFFNSKNKTREWSGILYYRKNDKGDLIPIDIFFMDIGTAASTEYKYDSDADAYTFDNYIEEIGEKVFIGQVHSHHNMETFFSGTDISDLKDNTIKSEVYFSLIVNNKHKYTAKIAAKTDIELSYKVLGGQVVNSTEQCIRVNDCTFTYEAVKVDQKYLDRFNKLEKIHKEEAKKKSKYLVGKKTPYTSSYYPSGGSTLPSDMWKDYTEEMSMLDAFDTIQPLSNSLVELFTGFPVIGQGNEDLFDAIENDSDNFIKMLSTAEALELIKERENSHMDLSSLMAEIGSQALANGMYERDYNDVYNKLDNLLKEL